MKFSSMKSDGFQEPMMTTEKRFFLKNHLEKTIIPSILADQGADFCCSMIVEGSRFLCDLYNAIWERYANEHPFCPLDFLVYSAANDDHIVLYAVLPEIPGAEGMGICGIGLACDPYGLSFTNVRAYYTYASRIDNSRTVFEIHGPNGRVGCTPSKKITPFSHDSNEIIDLIWKMAFDENGDYAMELIFDEEELIEYQLSGYEEPF